LGCGKLEGGPRGSPSWHLEQFGAGRKIKMSLREIARTLMQETFMTPGWSEDSLVVWLRDGCRCVYCYKDMLQSYDVLFYDSAFDHLLPRKVYPSLEERDWNRVLACRACNTIKHAYDPSLGQASESVLLVSPPAEVTRAEWIDNAKAFIEQQRSPYRENFYKQRAFVVRALLQPREQSAAAGS
jgi:hypothetical protein